MKRLAFIGVFLLLGGCCQCKDAEDERGLWESYKEEQRAFNEGKSQYLPTFEHYKQMMLHPEAETNN